MPHKYLLITKSISKPDPNICHCVQDHPNVLSIYEIWENNDICSIVSEYLHGGDLLNYCNKQRLPLPEPQVCIIVRQLMRALRYLHGQNVVHADVKLENCLFATPGDLESLKLVDFGLSLNIRDAKSIPEGVRGTLNYMAPEILLADRGRPIMAQVCDRTDVWAAGVVLFTLSCGFLPFNGASQGEVIQQMTAPEAQIQARLMQSPQF